MGYLASAWDLFTRTSVPGTKSSVPGTRSLFPPGTGSFFPRHKGEGGMDLGILLLKRLRLTLDFFLIYCVP